MMRIGERRFGLREKMVLPFYFEQMIVLIGLVFILVSLVTRQRLLAEHISQAQQVTQRVDHLESLQTQIGMALLSYRFRADAAYLTQIQESQDEISVILEEINPLFADSLSKHFYERYITSRDGADRVRDRLIASIQEGDEQAIIREFMIWSTKANHIDAALADLSIYSIRSLERVSNEYLSLVQRIRLMIVAILVLLVFSSLLFVYYLRSMVTRPIVSLSRVASEVAEGDFDSEIRIHSDDEIGYLARDLQLMKEKLKEYYQHLVEDVLQKEELLRKKKELERRKDEFISAASHELKTPLTTQKLYAELLLDMARKRKDTELERYADKITIQTGRLTKLVNELLDVSKIHAGKLALAKEELNLDGLVLDLVEDMKRLYPDWQFQVAGKVPAKVEGDLERLRQVFINLLTNAVKYSPSGSKVWVRLVRTDGRVEVSIQDSGMGIERKHLRRIFQRFYRVHKEGVSTQGLGMGLYISSQIVKLHGGKLWVESSIGTGSTFHVVIPCNGIKTRSKGLLKTRKKTNSIA